jgi:hypothetical protein
MVIERDPPQDAPASTGRVPTIPWASGAAIAGSERPNSSPMQGLHPLSSPVHLRPCRFCLVDPQDHVHGPVQGESCGERRARQLLLASLGIQRAEAAATVGLERAHAQRPGQGEALAVGGFGPLGIGGWLMLDSRV